MTILERRIRYSVMRRDSKVEQPLKWLVALIIFVLCLGVTFSEAGGDGYQLEAFVEPPGETDAIIVTSDFLSPGLEAAELPPQ